MSCRKKKQLRIKLLKSSYVTAVKGKTELPNKNHIANNQRFKKTKKAYLANLMTVSRLNLLVFIFIKNLFKKFHGIEILFCLKCFIPS